MPQGESSVLGSDGRWAHVFHQSGLSDIDFCPERGRQTLLGTMPGVPTDSMVLGTVCHAGFESLLHESDYDEAVEIMQNEFVECGPFVFDKYNLNTFWSTAHHIVGVFEAEVLPSLSPQVIEHEFKHLVYNDAERDIYFGGVIDYIGKDGNIKDWKTGNKKFVPWEQQRFSTQATMYCLAGELEFNTNGRFEFVQITPKGEVRRCAVKRNRGDYEWLMRKALGVAKTVEQQLPEWPLNDQGWWCSPKWCGLWNECKGAHVRSGWDKPPKQA